MVHVLPIIKFPIYVFKNCLISKQPRKLNYIQLNHIIFVSKGISIYVRIHKLDKIVKKKKT